MRIYTEKSIRFETRERRDRRHAHQTINLSHRRAERGSTTAISLLVLFALLGLGMLSLRFTHQDMSSAGNLRQAKQARYVAEMGLHHAITLLQQQGNYLLGIRKTGEYFRINSEGKIKFYAKNPAGIEVLRREIDTPIFPALTEGPSPFGVIRNRVPSYEIRIEGISEGPTPPGQELSQSDLGTPRQHFCLVYFSSRGLIAQESLPETDRQVLGEQAWRASLEIVAEHRLKAAVILGPFLIPSCDL